MASSSNIYGRQPWIRNPDFHYSSESDLCCGTSINHWKFRKDFEIEIGYW